MMLLLFGLELTTVCRGYSKYSLRSSREEPSASVPSSLILYNLIFCPLRLNEVYPKSTTSASGRANPATKVKLTGCTKGWIKSRNYKAGKTVFMFRRRLVVSRKVSPVLLSSSSFKPAAKMVAD